VLVHAFTYIQRPYAYRGDRGLSILVMGGMLLAEREAVVINDVFVGDKYKYKIYSKMINNIAKTITVILILYKLISQINLL
jgi:hypothetical protein